MIRRTRRRAGAALAVLVAAVAWSTSTPAQDRPPPAPSDGPTWISEDVEAGYRAAKASGKPLLIAFR